MVKVMSFRFQLCFGPFTMSLVEVSSETRLFRHLKNHVFRSPSVQKNISYEGHFVLKIFKVDSKFRKCRRKLEKKFASVNNAINCLY